MLRATLKPLLFIPSISLLLLTGAGCSHTNHDKDSLYVHGFIAPVGETALPPKAITPPTKTKTTNTESAEVTSQLEIILRDNETIISQQTMNTPANWPAAYKIDFHPPQIAEIDEQQITLSLILINADKQQTLFQKDIQLNNPMLFSTAQDILVHKTLNTASEYTQENNEETEANGKLPAPYESFNCDDRSPLNAYITDTYLVLGDSQQIIPRVITSPTPVYGSADIKISFDNNRSFTFEKNERIYNCQLNENSFNPTQQVTTEAQKANNKDNT